jgi:hypothetical protein
VSVARLPTTSQAKTAPRRAPVNEQHIIVPLSRIRATLTVALDRHGAHSANGVCVIAPSTSSLSSR